MQSRWDKDGLVQASLLSKKPSEETPSRPALSGTDQADASDAFPQLKDQPFIPFLTPIRAGSHLWPLNTPDQHPLSQKERLVVFQDYSLPRKVLSISTPSDLR